MIRISKTPKRFILHKSQYFNPCNGFGNAPTNIYSDEYIYRDLGRENTGYFSTMISLDNVSGGYGKISCLLGKYELMHKEAFDWIYDMNQKKIVSSIEYEKMQGREEDLFVYIYIPTKIKNSLVNHGLDEKITFSFEYNKKDDKLIMMSNLDCFNRSAGLSPDKEIVNCPMSPTISYSHKITKNEKEKFGLSLKQDYYLVFIKGQHHIISSSFLRKHKNIGRGYNNILIKDDGKWLLGISWAGN